VIERGSWNVAEAVNEQPWLPNGPIPMNVTWRGEATVPAAPMGTVPAAPMGTPPAAPVPAPGDDDHGARINA
jgi:hypothetical protein